MVMIWQENAKKKKRDRRSGELVMMCQCVTVWCPLHKKPKKLGKEMFSGRRMFYTVTQATPGHL